MNCYQVPPNTTPHTLSPSLDPASRYHHWPDNTSRSITSGTNVVCSSASQSQYRVVTHICTSVAEHTSVEYVQFFHNAIIAATEDNNEFLDGHCFMAVPRSRRRPASDANLLPLDLERDRLLVLVATRRVFHPRSSRCLGTSSHFAPPISTRVFGMDRLKCLQITRRVLQPSRGL